MRTLVPVNCGPILESISSETFRQPPHKAHIWFVRIDDLEFVHPESLSAEERSRALRYRFEPDRVSFTGTRAFLRLLLGHYAGTDPASLEFGYTPHGKPFLINNPTLSFNVSRRAPCSFIVVTNGAPAGIDIERVRQDVDCPEIASQHFSAREIDWLNGKDDRHKIQDFFRLWVIKEAVLKADGRGLSVQLKEVDVDLKDRPSVNLTWGGWNISEYTLSDNCLGAVALSPSTESVITFPLL